MISLTHATTLAMRQLRRDIRLSEYLVVFSALVLAVAALTSVGFFADRVERAMAAQAATLLAADATISMSQPLPSAIRNAAQTRGLAIAELVEFPSVVVNAAGDTALVSIKAIRGDYPLRGDLLLSKELYGEATTASGAPPGGAVWIDSRLPGTLAVSVGETMSLGDIDVAVDAYISYEPDRTGDVFQMAPRVMMSLEDLPRAGLLGAGSRARYRMLFAGAEPVMAEFTGWLREQQSEHKMRIITPEEGRPSVRSALTNARRFLGLAAALAVLLAGAAVALAARQIAQRDMDSSALLRTFGASRKTVVLIVVIRLTALALLAGLVGSVLGYLAQFGLSAMLSRFFNTALPQPTLLPLIGGFGCSMIAMAGFCLPAVWKASDAPVVRVLRRDLPATLVGSRIWLSCGLASLLLLLVWLTRDGLTALLLLAGVVGVFILLAGISRGLVALAERTRWPWLRRLLSGVRRRPQSVTLQISAFGVGLLALLLLAIVRADVLATWQRQIPADAPNFFLINIQPDEVSAVQKYFSERQVQFRQLYPMIRGRLDRINERVIDSDSYSGQRNSRMAQREFNLSFAAEQRDDNPTVAGQWWPADSEQNFYSVEQGIAEQLGIELGDTLHFRVADTVVSGEVTHLREVEWESFEVNFFVVGSPAVFSESPASYITSVRVKDDLGGFVRELVTQFPSITVLEVGSILERVSGIMNRAAAAVQYVFLFSLFAGVLVLIAAVLASRRERFHEAAILRTLGASRRYLHASLLREFAIIGLLAGTLASTMAVLVGWLLVEYVMDLTYHFNAGIWVLGIVLGVVCIGCAGMLVTRPVLNQSPLQVLRSQV